MSVSIPLNSNCCCTTKGVLVAPALLNHGIIIWPHQWQCRPHRGRGIFRTAATRIITMAAVCGMKALALAPPILLLLVVWLEEAVLAAVVVVAVALMVLIIVAAALVVCWM